MNNLNRGGAQDFVFVESKSKVAIGPLLRLVYVWMFFGLLTTAAVSFVVASSTQVVTSIAPYIFPLFIVELLLVMVLAGAVSKTSPTIAGIIFFIYAAINGLTLGVLFWAYIAAGEAMAIAAAFFTTAGLFGTMSVIGYTTRVDLSKYSTFFLMALIGLFIAMIVNWFLSSPALYYIVSVVGVLLFTALTAYDTQRIKQLAAQPQYQEYGDSTTSMAIYGALILYLDFINLFVFLLRLFGGRD